MKIHLQCTKNIAECGWGIDVKTTKDKSKVSCKLCLDIIDAEKELEETYWGSLGPDRV
jgi:hypothetical protein